jgi:hypothetical protein
VNLCQAAISLSSEQSKRGNVVEIQYRQNVANKCSVVQDTFYSHSLRDRKISHDLEFTFANWIGKTWEDVHMLPASWFQWLGRAIDASATLRKDCYDEEGQGQPPSPRDWVTARQLCCLCRYWSLASPC